MNRDDSEWDTALESIIHIPDSTLTPQSPGYEKRYGAGMIDVAACAYHDGFSPQDSLLTPTESETATVGESENHAGSVGGFVDTTILSKVSTTFHPAANLLPTSPDLVLVSSDNVLFYVHTSQLPDACANRLDSLIPTKTGKHGSDDRTARVPETATVLNILLHVVYNMSCTHYKPDLHTLIAAVDAMPFYGLSPEAYVAPSSILYALILGQAPMRPLAVYALAARHDLYELAKPVSGYLLSFPLHQITDELASQIGAVYLKRLFSLHIGRLEALKRILLPPPHPHPPTAKCDFMEQKKVTRSWTLAAAYLVWYAYAVDLSPSGIQSVFSPLADRLSCLMCKQSLADRLKQLLVQWSFVQRTI